ncbi:UDP-glucuronic acid decarboxylase family protein [Prochlorococcus marinus]|uniref:UDP-glucuronate decarboxylase n=1 Tax=Prochlorococcus marinus XMU1408 TaxID=2213228 RepID=A0A318QYG1_PROMR|nr:UDP-glucuronic acid decarboxylase family protein [Prochlorococcus marinus]MBW3041372.1 NAD-dependent dehydratase [Prochlorococcus marinus str. XMU1408]PYE02537.1 NAD-dependent dehydratase [Prochlorococcus marinus XMU1408]
MAASPLKNLITGGAGFLGSHLVDRLMRSGEKVICLDNFFTGSEENIKHWIGHPYFELIPHDVTDPIKLDVDRIWHLACPASPIHYQFNPIKTAKTSFLGTYNMLGLARRVGARILFASTSEVYGNPEIHPQSEEYSGNVNPIGIRSCYDEGKRVAESLCYDYMRMHKIEIRIARIFNTYGPRMLLNDGRLISNLLIQSINGEDLTIYGNGYQTRSFCFIDDLIDSLILFMDSSNTGPMNLGNPEELSILEIANLIKSMSDKKVNIKFLKELEDDPFRRKPEISLANKELGWRPRIMFNEGLKITREYFQKKLTSGK